MVGLALVAELRSLRRVLQSSASTDWPFEDFVIWSLQERSHVFRVLLDMVYESLTTNLLNLGCMGCLINR